MNSEIPHNCETGRWFHVRIPQDPSVPLGLIRILPDGFGSSHLAALHDAEFTLREGRAVLFYAAKPLTTEIMHDYLLPSVIVARNTLDTTLSDLLEAIQ